MRINFVLPSLNPSGGVRVVKDYCKWLNEHGHDALIYVPSKEAWKYIIKHQEFGEYNVPLVSPRFVRDADITIATAWDTAKTVLDLQDRRGTKAYFIQHYETLWDERAKVTYDYPLKQIVVSNWLYKVLSLFHNNNPYIVENGIKLPSTVYKDTTKKNVTILMPYRQEGWKGTEDGIEALKLIYNDHPECRYQVYGWKIGDVPCWIEPFENPTDKELNELYYNADIFLFPSHSEGFGLPPLEAMARMCAVVTTNVGAVPEYTNDGEYAVLVEPENVPGMWLAVNTLIKNKELRTGYQVLAYEASKRWSFDIAAKRFEECLTNLI